MILCSEDCPNADEILANIVIRGGNVKLEIDHEQEVDSADGYRDDDRYGADDNDQLAEVMI